MNDAAITMTRAPAPENFAVTLPVTPDLRVKLRLADGALELAHSFEIDSNDMAQLAVDQRNTFLKSVDVLKELKKGFVEPAKVIIGNAEALFDDPIAELGSAVKHLNSGLVGWDQKEKARLAREKAEREAEERRIRQEADQKAAQERARAEAAAAEQRRKAEEAAEAQRKAEAEGNARAAAAAAAARAAAEEKERAAIENGEAKAQEAQMSAAAQVAAVVAPTVAKLTGAQFRKNWIAEITPGLTEQDVISAIARAAIVGGGESGHHPRPELLALLNLDMSACTKMAKAFEGATRIPGMTAVDRPIAAGSKR